MYVYFDKESEQRVPIKSLIPFDEMEMGAFRQLFNFSKLPFLEFPVFAMPDVHQGYALPIGGVVATKPNIIMPYAVGMDGGCGMGYVKLDITHISKDEIEKVFSIMRERVPLGHKHHDEPQEWRGFDDYPAVQLIEQELGSMGKQLGTLGSGNHFEELQQGSDGHIYAMVHTGSRNIGARLCKLYHSKAVNHCKEWYSNIPNPELSFLNLDTKDGQDYYAGLRFILEFARANRELILEHFVNALHIVTGASVLEYETIHHNYARMENHRGKNVMVHRKGATSAKYGETVIIPGSMGAKSYIARGLGNSDNLMSSAHGAGRKMSRGDAKRNLNLSTEQAVMSDIVHGLRTQDDLEEAPGAYKNIEDVIDYLTDYVEVTVELTPLGVIKGPSTKRRKRRR